MVNEDGIDGNPAASLVHAIQGASCGLQDVGQQWHKLSANTGFANVDRNTIRTNTNIHKVYKNVVLYLGLASQ